MINAPGEILYSEMSILEQREYLQELNPDMLAGVFSITGWESGSTTYGNTYSAKNVNNVLCCYPNQLEDGQIQLPEDFESGNIVIINLGYNYESAKNKVEGCKEMRGGLQKGNIEIVAGNQSKLPANTNDFALMSPGVIEYWEGKKGKKYTQTVLRDGGKMNDSAGITNLSAANSRTTAAGRNCSGSLNRDLEIENAEESPFLMQNEDGEYFLVTHNIEYKGYLIASIKNFLEKKYLTPDKDNYEAVKKAFELKFKGVNYDELGDILKSIIDGDNFAEYEWEEGEIEGLEKTNIQLGDESGEYYVFHDKENNTLEYRAIRKITEFSKLLKSVGRLPLRLFLESENQDPSFKSMRNIQRYGDREKTLVPTMDDVAKKIQATF